MNVSYNPILKPHVESFKKSGALAGGGDRQAIPPDAVPQVKAQLTQQMDQIIMADNTSADQNPEPGKVTQEMPEHELSMKAEFVGNTAKGNIAVDAVAPDLESSAYAEFTETGALIIQSASTDGEPGFVGVHLDYNGGESYIESLNLPDGFSVF